MNEARAGVFGDVFAFEQRNLEIVAACVKGMRRDQASRIDFLEKLPFLDARGLEKLLSQGICEDKSLPGPGPIVRGRIRDFEKAVLDLLREGDRAISGDGPGRRRPDDDAWRLTLPLILALSRQGRGSRLCPLQLPFLLPLREKDRMRGR